MKTSNKILLFVLLAFMLILTGLHLALYAKIKSGDFAAASEITSRIVHHALPEIKNVSITGLVNCQLVVTGQPGLETENLSHSRLSFKVVNDTLFLNGDSIVSKEDYARGLRNHQWVKLILPSAQHVKLSYGALNLEGGIDPASAPSWSIELTTDAHVGIISRKPEEAKMFFKQLNLVANRSSLELANNTVIDSMTVNTTASNLNFRQAKIDQLTMVIDDNTTVSMQGKNIKSITTTTKP